MSLNNFSDNSSVISSADFSLPLLIPGSPWIPIPISISSAPISNVGLAACGNIVGVNAMPIVLIFSLVFNAILFTSSKSAPVSAIAPVVLNTYNIPVTPLLFSFSSFEALATSSATTIDSTLISSISSISLAISKFITSPP